MHRSLSAVALCIGGLLAMSIGPALAADPSPDASPAVAGGLGVPLEGTTWQLTNLRLSGAYAPIPSGASATLLLLGGHASGVGGCNQWFADYTLSGDALTFGTIGSTSMACDDVRAQVETFYLADLPAVAHWAIDGDVLTLSADDGQPVLAYVAPTGPSLVGDWDVTAYADSSGVMSVFEVGTVTLTFDTSTVSGTAGCNDFQGPWMLAGSALSIGPLVSTQKACEPAEVMAREAAVMADLEASTELRADFGDSVDLVDASGMTRLGLVPAVAVAGPSASPAT